MFYCDALFGIKPSGLGNWGIALVGLWVPAAVNLAGIRQTAWLQNLTVALKYLPLLFVAVAGWFFVTKANFGAFNTSGAACTPRSGSPPEWRCSRSSVWKRRPSPPSGSRTRARRDLGLRP